MVGDRASFAAACAQRLSPQFPQPVFRGPASEHVRETAYSDQWPVATAEGRFDRINIERPPLGLPLEAEKVTRLRVEIVSYFKPRGRTARGRRALRAQRIADV
jgi:hypothetical protein